MIISPAGRLGPVAALADHGRKIVMDVSAQQRAVGLAEYP